MRITFPKTIQTGLILLAVAVAGCGDSGRDPILGTSGELAGLPPAVTAVAPLNGATGVAINNTIITAAFSEPMDALTAGDFTVTCSAPCTAPDGTATLNAAGTVATFALASGTALDLTTEYTGTISGATSRATGFGLQQPYIWRFTTRASSDTTRPRVTVTQPATTTPGPTAGVPVNSAITAVFTENMAPASIDQASFTLTCAAPCVAPGAAVSYSVGSRTATLAPNAVLEVGETYTATVTTAATDVALNALAGNQAALPAASDYVWQFTTTTAAPAGNVSVFSTEPVNAGMVCPTDAVNTTFTVPSGLRMDPNSITAATFSVTGSAPLLAPVVAATVSLDAPTGTIATFVPLNDLTVGETYTAVVKGGSDGVKDLALPANTMLNDVTWTFTVAPASGSCLEPVALNTAQPYGVFGGSAGMTNTGIQTVIDGDIGTISTDTSTVTGFHDTGGDVYTETLANIGAVNGLIYTCTNSTTGPTLASANAVSCNIATNARLDAEVAYLELAGLPGGPDPGAGNLANLTLAPGVYTASLGSFMIEGGDLTLDAQGDANAVWVFQMATTLTVGGPGAAFPQSIVLTNGALAKNVFWQVGSAATINAAGGGTMVGTIISQAGVAFSTVGNTDITTLNGRALSLGASVTLVDTIINVPSN